MFIFGVIVGAGIAGGLTYWHMLRGRADLQERYDLLYDRFMRAQNTINEYDEALRD